MSRVRAIVTIGAIATCLALMCSQVIAAGVAGYCALYIFCARKDGKGSGTQLLLDQSGNLFGTTPLGGSDNHGVVFELTP